MSAANLHVVCPHCLAVNRLSATKLGDGPRCGGCQQSLLDAPPVPLSAQSFSKVVNRNDLPVVIDCWAPWCGPCRAMAPAFEQAARELQGRVYFAKLNTEDEPALGGKLHIRSIPTLLLFAEGQEVARQSGAMSAADIVRWVSAHAQ